MFGHQRLSVLSQCVRPIRSFYEFAALACCQKYEILCIAHRRSSSNAANRRFIWMPLAFRIQSGCWFRWSTGRRHGPLDEAGPLDLENPVV